MITDPTIWRGPDGRHWAHTDSHQDIPQNGRRWLHDITPALQNPDTGRWTPDPDPDATPVTIPTQLPQAGYTRVSADPWHEPLIATLHTHLAELLADYQDATGHPHPRADDLRHNVEDIAMLRDQLRDRAHAAYGRGHSSRRRP
ncbi:hypothetical protein [Streptomyces acidiscabies]|uniref:Uncharacterized protein n=1 Tax=Streptomyces acidiscabies TaxID=42234 RepID=A0ABU4MA65_9ACTN|nr:hypothetical protein [Streptomyces acidiscabies]MDX3024052.1 hypothetical protein [Streptomyces acidiscabies]